MAVPNPLSAAQAARGQGEQKHPHRGSNVPLHHHHPVMVPHVRPGAPPTMVAERPDGDDEDRNDEGQTAATQRHGDDAAAPGSEARTARQLRVQAALASAPSS